MIRIAHITKTCEAMPAQWEGRTSDDRAIYIRFRHGYLTVQVSDPSGSIDDAIGIYTDTPPVLEFELRAGQMGNSQMDEDELRILTSSIIDWTPSDSIR